MTDTLLAFLRSKHDMYKYWTEHAQVLLPSKQHCRVSKWPLPSLTHSSCPGFLGQLKSGEKKFIRNAVCKKIVVPQYPEVSAIEFDLTPLQLCVKKLYPLVSSRSS